MSFESGSISFRMYTVPGDVPPNAAEQFARNGAPPLRTLGVEPISGWVGGRHLLDQPVSEDNAWYGGYLRLYLMEAERRVPASFFRAHCLMEEYARLQAEHRPFLNRRERSEIKAEVMDRLLPDMPPQVRGLPFVMAPNEHLLYAGATTEKQSDLFRVMFLKTTGLEAIPLDPATTAALRRKVDIRGWSRTSFTPELPDEEMGETPGEDFLTWLWFSSETRGGIWTDERGARIGYQLEGPLLFTREGDGAQEAVLRRGAPMLSTEARACLLAGKKLRRARLLLVRDDETWRATVDAATFVFRSLRLPEEQEKGLDPISRFQDRMNQVAAFREAFFGLYERFIDERIDASSWAATVKEMRQWAAERPARA